MTKEERNLKLNEILAIYKNSPKSLKFFSEKFGIGVQTIKKFLEINNIKIKTLPSSGKGILDEIYSLKDNFSESELCNKFNVEPIIIKLAKSGLDKKSFKQKLINLAIEEYKNLPEYDKNATELSRKYGLNRKTIIKYLKEQGIKIVANGIKTNFNFSAFDKIDNEESAYWLGFLYADGCVGATRHSLALNISLKDLDHMEKFCKFMQYRKGKSIHLDHQFGSKNSVNKNGKPIYMISTIIRDDHLWNSLIDKGCVPNKSLILTFPDETMFSDKKLIFDFIRGYCDGDGTIGMYPHSKTNPNKEESLMFVGTKDFLNGIQKYLGKGYLMHKSNCDENTFRLSYSTSKAHKAAELIYKNAKIYLTRKYNIYINEFATKNRAKTVKAETPTPC